MPRKKQYQWDVETNGQEAPEQLSRSAKKRQSSALQDLGAELTKLPVNETAEKIRQGLAEKNRGPVILE